MNRQSFVGEQIFGFFQTEQIQVSMRGAVKKIPVTGIKLTFFEISHGAELFCCLWLFVICKHFQTDFLEQAAELRV